MKLDYEHYWDQSSSHSNHPSVRLRNRFIMSQLSKLEFNSLLDVGCGDGFLLNSINDKFSNKTLSGCDLSNSIIKIDSSKYPDIKFYQFDISNADLNTENQFDVVVCSEVIEHLEDWETALKNISSMTAEHGFLVLTTQSGKRFKSDIDNGHIQHFKLDYLKEKLMDLGLKPIIAYKTGFPFYNMQKFLHEKIESTAHNFQKGSRGDSFLGKFIFSLTYHLFILTPKSGKLGPQIFIVAKKESK